MHGGTVAGLLGTPGGADPHRFQQPPRVSTAPLGGHQAAQPFLNA